MAAAKQSGCGLPPASVIGESTNFNLTMRDPATGDDVLRTYAVNVPATYDPNKKYPVIYWFHGWSDMPTDRFLFDPIGQENGVITVYPMGMNDEDTVPPRYSWNFGDANHTNTCTSQSEPASSCYNSCKKLNKCSRCNWATCTDDVAFVKTLIERINRDYCVDDKKLYMSGASNGGMFVYYLAS